MRGPGTTESAVSPSNSPDASTSGESDPCTSPPCKRLKQAVLAFPSPAETEPLNSTPNTPNGSYKNTDTVNISQPTPSASHDSDVVIIADNAPAGGLVTAAPSPPDKKQSSVCHTPPKTPSSKTTPADAETKTSPSTTLPQTNKAVNDKTPLRPTSAEKLKKKEERERLRNEKLRQKEEKEKQRLEAKAAKEKERLEAKQKKEQERLEKQAEKEKKEKERLEKKQREEKDRLEKKEKKEEEKRKKEEEINAKIEEKKKREEKKKQEEEEKMKKKEQAKNNFVNFFITAPAPTPKTLPKATERFQPFQVAKFMTLAPTTRRKLEESQKQSLTSVMLKQDESNNKYLHEIKTNKPPLVKAKRRSKIKATKVNSGDVPMEVDGDKKDSMISLDDDDDDENSNGSSVVELEQEEKKKCMKAILLQFAENYRPAYYGTHRKKSKKISPKNPFKKDEVLLDYEVDSDEEWEEEEPGESLSNSEGEDEDNEDNDEDDEDEGFFVPHGYLSDDEGIEEDEEGNGEGKQQQQLAKAKAWEAELKKKFKPLRPIAVGCCWGEDALSHELLQRFEAITLVYDSSIMGTDCGDQAEDFTGRSTPDSVHPAAMVVPEEAIPDLIQFVHSSSMGINKLIRQFREFWSNKCSSLEGCKKHISKRQLERKIQAIAVKERRQDRKRWYVQNHILEQYGMLGRLQPRDLSPAPDMEIIPAKPGIKSLTQVGHPGSALETDPLKCGLRNSTEQIGAAALSSLGSSQGDDDVVVTGISKPQKPVTKRRIATTLISTDLTLKTPSGTNASRSVIGQAQSTDGNQMKQQESSDLNSKALSTHNANTSGSQLQAKEAKRRIVPTLISSDKTEVKKIPPNKAPAKKRIVPTPISSDIGTKPSSSSNAEIQKVAPPSEAPAKKRIVPTPISSDIGTKPSSSSNAEIQKVAPPNEAPAKKRIVLTPISSDITVKSSTTTNNNTANSVTQIRQKEGPSKTRIVPTPSPTDIDSKPCENNKSAESSKQQSSNSSEVPPKRRIIPTLVIGSKCPVPDASENSAEKSKALPVKRIAPLPISPGGASDNPTAICSESTAASSGEKAEGSTEPPSKKRVVPTLLGGESSRDVNTSCSQQPQMSGEALLMRRITPTLVSTPNEARANPTENPDQSKSAIDHVDLTTPNHFAPSKRPASPATSDRAAKILKPDHGQACPTTHLLVHGSQRNTLPKQSENAPLNNDSAEKIEEPISSQGHRTVPEGASVDTASRACAVGAKDNFDVSVPHVKPLLETGQVLNSTPVNS
ncbi:uncharacterized protein LOC116615698 [Nematostella vectensis]|uniref:uncharacterized protein LOC116615698 n=1 Tax=Nematostella vectensis TaxID=45351 RepID=UPI0020772082|nr:uncharacterized protein LOC116615698 [Nematostella vectensis]